MRRGPFRVADRLSEFSAPAPGMLRRAGVSSFGIGGTNAHVVLEEGPARDSRPPARQVQLLPLSAMTANALSGRIASLQAWIADRTQQDLADAAFTLQVGRRVLPWRACLTASDVAETQSALAALLSARHAPVPANPPSIAFMFSGQGSQYPHMAASLYRNEPLFRGVLNQCAELLRRPLGQDLPRAPLRPVRRQ